MYACIRKALLFAPAAPCVLARVLTTSAHALPAFPGAEGFGGSITGGRGGAVIKVTTLAASGPGSLQAALDAPGHDPGGHHRRRELGLRLGPRRGTTAISGSLDGSASDGGSTQGAADDGGSSGCGCRSAASGTPFALALPLVLAGRRRRRPGRHPSRDCASPSDQPHSSMEGTAS